MQLVLLVIVFSLLFVAVALLSIERARKKKASRAVGRPPQIPAEAGANAALTPQQRRARRRRARMNATRANDPLRARARPL